MAMSPIGPHPTTITLRPWTCAVMIVWKALPSGSWIGTGDDRPEHRARHPGRAMDVHAHLDEPRHDLFNLGLRGPFFHYNQHGVSRLLHV